MRSSDRALKVEGCTGAPRWLRERSGKPQLLPSVRRGGPGGSSAPASPGLVLSLPGLLPASPPVSLFPRGPPASLLPVTALRVLPLGLSRTASPQTLLRELPQRSQPEPCLGLHWPCRRWTGTHRGTHGNARSHLPADPAQPTPSLWPVPTGAPPLWLSPQKHRPRPGLLPTLRVSVSTLTCPRPPDICVS